MNATRTVTPADPALAARPTRLDFLSSDDKDMLRAARDAVKDLGEAKGAIYWPDMLASAALGKVFTTVDGNLTAFSELDGRLLWTFQSNDAVISNIVVTRDQVIAATQSATFGVDTASGQQLWQQPQVGRLAVANGYLFIAGEYSLSAYQIE